MILRVVLLLFIAGCASNFGNQPPSLNPQTRPKYWYRILAPDQTAIAVGPWSAIGTNYCADWFGSALYHHGPLCHDHPNPVNCAPDGPGYAYPGTHGADCNQTSPQAGEVTNAKHGGWGFFWYPTAGGGSIVGGNWGRSNCERIRKTYASQSHDAGTAGSECAIMGR
jgi:hypothetical protein